MALSPGLNFLIAKYLRGLPNSNLANVNKFFACYLFIDFNFLGIYTDT